MKSRIVRLGVLIASVMGLLVTSTPAEATWVKNVTLNGIATLSNCNSTGFGYPTDPDNPPLTTTTTKPGPKATDPDLVNTTVSNGNTCDFSFIADCVKESVGTKKDGVDTCTIAAMGTVTGFCGLSSGLGKAVLTNTSSDKETVLTDFKFSSTATTLRVSDKTPDDDPNQWIKGEVLVNPNVAAGGSCTNKSVTSFLITGDVTIKRCTQGAPSPPC